MKYSVTNKSFESVLKNNSDALPLLLGGCQISKDASPTDDQSSASDTSMNKSLKGEKLSNLQEMYENYIPKDRWITQLLNTLPQPSDGSIINAVISQHQKFESKSLRVGQLVGSPSASAQVHSILRRTGDSGTQTGDAAIVKKLDESPNIGIRTMPRRRRNK